MAESFGWQPPKCAIPGIPGTEIPGSALVWFYLRLFFSFNFAFSYITPINSLLLKLARICFCCLQAKDHNRDK